jgi:hypothetical protein
VLTHELVRDHPDIFEPPEGQINETYLFHGATVRAALSIAQADFNLDMAGSGRGAMYGPGAYFAESCTKADEYAHGERGGYYGDDVRAALLCRVCMGKLYYTTQFGQEDAADKVTKGWCDSVLGDLSKFRKTFREFVIYDADQVYPEYVLLYSRVHRAEGTEAAAASQANFHLELPVYWRNCHVDPKRHAFNEQCRLRRSTSEALQRLVSESSSAAVAGDDGGGAPLRLRAAWRVEHSKLWCQYVEFKADVRAGLTMARCAYTNEVGAGFVATMGFLRDQFVEASMSVDNLDPSLNEHLLWFEASRETVHAVASGELDICSHHGGECSEEAFGRGAYFSDDLRRRYAPALADEEEDRVRYVLLCRVCLGKIHFTDQEAAPDAHEEARREGKDSVLACPAGSDRREFVALVPQQAYPEFILELQADSENPILELPRGDE